ncbi:MULTISPECIES: IS110 family transposase [Gordonia]|uniref:IS110 family transposase n=1 Tax=Gordonia TaxID=2053 RepID=UPI003265761F
MSIVANVYDYVIGVDTHSLDHCYVICDAGTGEPIAPAKKFPTTTAGTTRAIAWCHKLTASGSVLAAVEGTGSYGRQLSGALLDDGIAVAEVRPGRIGGDKSDAIDAAKAAESVRRLDTTRLTAPRARGDREALQIYCAARYAISKDVVADKQRLIALLRRIDLGIDARHGVGTAKIATIITRWARPHRSDDSTKAAARAESVRLARRIVAGTKELRRNATVLAKLVAGLCPGLLELAGVGPITAARILVSWSHAGKFPTEAAFAMHAGVAPLRCGSGKTDEQHHRFNYGGDRQLNSAFYWIARSRMTHSERTKAYVDKLTANGKTPKMARRAVMRYVTRDIYRYLEDNSPQPAPTA